MTRPVPLALALALAALASAGAQATGKDDAMLKLATASGCMTCHQVEPGARGSDGLAPIGPALTQVAARYRGQRDAVDRLSRTVVVGSNPYDGHWKGQISGLAMPPNAVAVNDADARWLVRWILSLDTGQ